MSTLLTYKYIMLTQALSVLLAFYPMPEIPPLQPKLPPIPIKRCNPSQPSNQCPRPVRQGIPPIQPPVTPMGGLK